MKAWLYLLWAPWADLRDGSWTGLVRALWAIDLFLFSILGLLLAIKYLFF